MTKVSAAAGGFIAQEDVKEWFDDLTEALYHTAGYMSDAHVRLNRTRWRGALNTPTFPVSDNRGGVR